jgi:hypothetical protein
MIGSYHVRFIVDLICGREVGRERGPFQLMSWNHPTICALVRCLVLFVACHDFVHNGFATFGEQSLPGTLTF